MTKRYKFISLTVVILAYALMQIATKKEICDADCEILQDVFEELDKTYPDVNNIYRCSYNTVSDTVCVFVQSNSSVDWDQVAVKTCTLATANGLPQQKVFVIHAGSTGNDTLARLQCP